MRTKALIAAALVAGALLLLEYPKVYVIRGNGGGVLYWDVDRALLVMDESSQGAHMSFLRYAADPYFFELGQTHSVDDNACSQVLIIQITAEDVKTFHADLMRNNCLGLQLFDGNFYAVRWPVLWKWSGGTNFDRPSPDEYGAYAKAFDAGMLPPGVSSKTPWQFDNVDGWSMRQLGSVGPKYEFKGRPVTATQLSLNGQSVSFIFSGETFPQMPIAVDLVRSGQSPQTIWSFDGRPHRVNKAEYERVFPPVNR